MDNALDQIMLIYIQFNMDISYLLMDNILQYYVSNNIIYDKKIANLQYIELPSNNMGPALDTKYHFKYDTPSGYIFKHDLTSKTNIGSLLIN